MEDQRGLRSPDRYTPAEEGVVKKRRTKEIAKRREELCYFVPRNYGPFAEDPTEAPPQEEIEKVREFLKTGLLKRLRKCDGDRKYKRDEEVMNGVLMLLDNVKIECKTWLYKLFVNKEWLDATHIEVGMFYLGIKQFQYNLQFPYATCNPYFLQAVKREHEKIQMSQSTVEKASEMAVIESHIVGSSATYAFSWAESEFVFMPLNTGHHWVLLVLEVKVRKIRVYNSLSRKGESTREIRQYLPSVQCLLPKIMDVHKVYQDIGEEPMGENKLEVEGVEECPQQTDGRNCGMYVLKIAELLIMGMDLDNIDANDMTMYRAKMTTELIMYSKKRTEEMKKEQGLKTEKNLNT